MCVCVGGGRGGGGGTIHVHVDDGYYCYKQAGCLSKVIIE